MERCSEGHSPLRVVWILLFLAVFAPGARSQHIYFDLDGDGLGTQADSIPANAQTTLDVWLVTDRNADGSPAACVGSMELSLNSYEVIVRAFGGHVRWVGYQNLLDSATVPCGEAQSDVDFHVGFGGSTVLPAGKYRLGALTVIVEDIGAGLTFATATPLSGVAATGFGSACAGLDGDNTLKLGLDWFDSGAITATTHYVQPVTAGATEVQSGAAYLAGNRFAAPMMIGYDAYDRPTVNGYRMDIDPGGRAFRRLSTQTESQAGRYALQDSVFAELGTLARAGATSRELLAAMEAAFRRSALVASVSRDQGGFVTVTYRDAPDRLHHMRLPEDLSRLTWSETDRRNFRRLHQRRSLHAIRDELEAGALLVAHPSGEWHLVQKRHVGTVEHALEQLRLGLALSESEASVLRRYFRDDSWAGVARRGRLLEEGP